MASWRTPKSSLTWPSFPNVAAPWAPHALQPAPASPGHRQHCATCLHLLHLTVRLLSMMLEGIRVEDLVQLGILTILWQPGDVLSGWWAPSLKESCCRALFLWHGHGQLPAPSRKHLCAHACPLWTIS